MALLNREELLKKAVLRIKKVELGNDEFVFVRQMTGRERDHFERMIIRPVYDKKGKLDHMEQALEDFRAKLAVNSLCDEEGNLLLKPEDMDLLSQNMSAEHLDKICSVAQELSGISEKDKEELVKNSEVGQAGDSTSV
jgi:hypothetical protein